MYLSPLGAGTLERAIIRPEMPGDQVNRFIGSITDKMNLSAINMESARFNAYVASTD